MLPWMQGFECSRLVVRIERRKKMLEEIRRSSYGGKIEDEKVVLWKAGRP
jgi:hypothetical protein